MPIGSIISQPASNSINAAYRPIVLRVGATKTNGDPAPPVVYCDIYFADVFYKTLSKTQYEVLNSGNSEWQFDIQDAVQEYLRAYLEANGESLITEAPLTAIKISCKFRSSGIDDDGFTIAEGTAPVQATSSSEAVSGSGTASNTFYGVNATLQHEDNQNLSDHLNAFKTGTWGATTWPLTHRPNPYLLCEEDSDTFPILSDQTPTSIVLHATMKDGTVPGGDDGEEGDLPCTNVSIPATELPDAVVDEAYSESITLGGTAPFNLTVNDKPSWMTVALDGNMISFTGTPDTEDTGLDIDITVTNCSEGSASFTDTIDVDAAPDACTPIAFDGTPQLPNAISGTSYVYDVDLTGTTPYAFSVTAKPAWMTISIVGSTLQFRGTPSNANINVDQVVSMSVHNDCGSADIDQIFQVQGSGKNVYVINDTDDTLTISNSNGTFSYAAGTGGNLPMADATFTLQFMPNGWGVKAIQSLPDTVTYNFGFQSQGAVLTTPNLTLTNYLWFNPPA